MTRFRSDDGVACPDAVRWRSVARRRFVAGRGRRRGFSLLELTVSLAIGGAAVAAAATLLTTLTTRADAIDAAALAVDHDANGERLLWLLTRSLDTSTDSAPLRGDAVSMTLRTWCETGLGWPEPCRVRLAFQEGKAFGALVAERLERDETGAPQVDVPPHPGPLPLEGERGFRLNSSSRPLPARGTAPDARRVTVLRGGLRSGRFIYLIDASNGGRWTDSWTLMTYPPAVAAVLDGDTLIMPL